MSELDEYKRLHTHLQQMPTILNAVGGVGGIKMDDGFKDLMKNISKNNPNNNMPSY
jgi:hypothetical protein